MEFPKMFNVISTTIRRMSSITLAKRPPISVFGIEGRYVSALYSAASTMDQLDQVENDFKALQQLITKPGIIDFIETSILSRAAKAKVMEEAGPAASLSPATTNFLAVVAENGRLKKLKRMITMFLAVMVAHRNEALCEVITATPLDDQTRAALMAAIEKIVKEGKKISLTEKVDPSIIGGMIVGVDDKHIDLSIARKVHLYTELLKQAV